MKNTLKHFYHTVWLSTLVVVLVLAVIFTLARALTPLLAGQRDSVERWASTLLDQPVQMNTIAIRWRYFTPVLQGKQVVIWNDARTHPLLKVDELDISLDMLGSLLSGHFKLARLRVIGAHITVQQTADGTVQINGINNLLPTAQKQDGVAGVDEFIYWIFDERRLILENINITWYNKDGKVLPISGLNLSLKNSGDHHLLVGEAALAQKIPSSVQFIIDLYGNWRAKEKITAKIYIDAQDVVLKQWLQDYAWHEYKINDGVADFEVWANWKNNKFENIQTLLSVEKLVVSAPDPKKSITFQPFISNLFWESQENNAWIFDADFRNLGFTRWNKVPGFSGLTGYVHATPTSGSLDLTSEQVGADFGPLFKAPLKFDALSGHIDWQQETDGWLVQGTDVSASNQDLGMLADFGLWLPADDSGPVISLLANTQAYGVAHIGNYLPLTIMQPSLVKWLSNSITRAENGAATLALQGRLADFPFDNNTGTFLIDVDVKDADVNYWPGWVPVKHANAGIVFSGRRMDINLISAQILQTAVQQIQFSIPLLKTGVQAVLSMQGNITSDLAQGLQFLQASPARAKVGGSLQGVSLTGPMQLQIQLTVPLEEGTVPLGLNGHIVTQNAELSIPDRNVRVTNLQGALDFTKDNITAPALTARLWDKPITIDLSSQPKIRLRVGYEGTPFTLLQDSQGWLLQIRNANVNGDVLIPRQSSQPLRARFSSIYIDPNAARNSSNLKPSQIPPVNFFANAVRYGDKNFGQVTFQLRPTNGNVQIVDLRVGSTGGQLVANGLWSNGATSLNGAINSQNLASFLTSLGFPAGITGSGKLVFKLNWPTALNNISLKRMNGSMVLALKQGQIVDIGARASAQMGLGRLLTSLSFQSLGRRFSSNVAVSAQGFEFDEMRGDFTLQNGSAYTTNLFLDGPVAQINLSGRIGLAAEDYDLTLKVTPHITSSLPLVAAGLAAANPIVGVGVFVANAVLGSTVQQVASSRYRLTGPWSQPIVKPM